MDARLVEKNVQTPHKTLSYKFLMPTCRKYRAKLQINIVTFKDETLVMM